MVDLLGNIWSRIHIYYVNFLFLDKVFICLHNKFKYLLYINLDHGVDFVASPSV